MLGFSNSRESDERGAVNDRSYHTKTAQLSFFFFAQKFFRVPRWQDTNEVDRTNILAPGIPRRFTPKAFGVESC